MSPWFWFLAGWLFAWVPAVFVFALALILDLPTERDEDKYWRKRVRPLRGTYAVLRVEPVHTVSRN